MVAKGIQPTNREGLPSFDMMNTTDDKAKEKPKTIPQILLMPNGKIKLPDFKGIDMRYTAELLQQGHLRLKPYGSGIAYQQKPAPGTEVVEGTTVEVWFK